MLSRNENRTSSDVSSDLRGGGQGRVVWRWGGRQVIQSGSRLRGIDKAAALVGGSGNFFRL